MQARRARTLLALAILALLLAVGVVLAPRDSRSVARTAGVVAEPDGVAGGERARGTATEPAPAASELVPARAERGPVASAATSPERDLDDAPATAAAVLCTVVGERGAPVAGATVRVLGVEPAATAITDAAGICELELGAPTVALTLRGSAPGRVSVAKELRPGLRRLELVLPVAAPLRGRVEDAATGAAIAGAPVLALFAGAESTPSTGTTDELGHFGPLVVPMDTMFELGVSAGGFTEHRERYVLADPSAAELVVALHRALAIRLRIVDAGTKAPLAAARVSAAGLAGPSWSATSTGIVRVHGGVPASGEARSLLIEAPGYCAAILSASRALVRDAGLLDVPLAVTLPRENAASLDVPLNEVLPSENAEPLDVPLDVPLPRENVVRLRFVGESGGAVLVRYRGTQLGHARVLVDREVGGWPPHLRWRAGPYVTARQVVPDADGVVTVANLPPGSLGLEVLDSAGRVLGTVDPFLGTGEVRDVVVPR